MWDHYGSHFAREQELKRLKDSIEVGARNYNIEVRLQGGLIKFSPIGVYANVLLEIEESSVPGAFVIHKHRNSSLTSQYKGKIVSRKWIIDFILNNAPEADRLILRAKNGDHERTGQDVAGEQLAIESIDRPPPPKPQEKLSYGYSTGKSICPVCNGDGGAGGQCYKCGGSGWA